MLDLRNVVSYYLSELSLDFVSDNGFANFITNRKANTWCRIFAMNLIKCQVWGIEFFAFTINVCELFSFSQSILGVEHFLLLFI